MAPYDATTNPYGGAAWQYLGANVRTMPTTRRRCRRPGSQNFGDVKVGFVGAVTDHLPELVSPAGIQGLTIEAPVVAANREADELKAAGRRHRRSCWSTKARRPPTSPRPPTRPPTSARSSTARTRTSTRSSPGTPTWPTTTPSRCRRGSTRAARSPAARSCPPASTATTSTSCCSPSTDTGTWSASSRTLLPLDQHHRYADRHLRPNYPADPAVQAIVEPGRRRRRGARRRRARQDRRAVQPGRSWPTAPTENRGGESTLGNLVAEVQQLGHDRPRSSVRAQIAFMNPGGLRHGHGAATRHAAAYPAALTYKQAATSSRSPTRWST